MIIFSFPASAADVSIAKPGSGGGIIASNPSGITCGSDCSGRFPPNSALTLTANPDAYSSFVAWQGGFCNGQNSTCAYTFGPPPDDPRYDPVTTMAAYFSGAAIGGSLGSSMALKSDGTVWAWGNNEYGQLGDGTTTNRSTPVQVRGLNDVIAIALPDDLGGHAVALKRDGTVWAWGRNQYGQLGDGTTTNRSTPVQVPGLNDVIAIAAGSGHTVVLKRDGTVWTWGWNQYGQLGDGTTTSRSTPVQSNMNSGSRGAIAIAAGATHTVALESANGNVYVWGNNRYGQVGRWGEDFYANPYPVIGIADIIAIAAGWFHTVALRSDGTVWAWGYNEYGQLGDGTTDDHMYPTRSGMDDATAIAASQHTVALKRDGTVWTWGYNQFGELGDGTTTSGSTPGQVRDLSGVTAISTGGLGFTMALGSDGTVWAWGDNQFGELGDGTTTQRLTPVQVHGPGNEGFLNLYVRQIPLGEALDDTSLGWSTSGDGDWRGQTQTSYYGDDAAQSGAISHNQVSRLETALTGPGTLTFYWKVSSEADYDFLRFDLDGVQQFAIAGAVDWQQKTVSVPSGQHALRWSYTKDGNVSTGTDAGWIDKVVYTPQNNSYT